MDYKKNVPNENNETRLSLTKRNATSDFYRSIDQASYNFKRNKKKEARIGVYTVGNCVVINVSMICVVCLTNFYGHFLLKNTLVVFC